MPSKKNQKTPSGAPTTKWLITAASVATILGGWVAFSSQPSTQPSTSGEDIALPTLATSLELEPIPTLMPTPNSRQRTFINSNTNTNVQTSLPTLRSVSAPQPKPAQPKPVTVTRSSH